MKITDLVLTLSIGWLGSACNMTHNAPPDVDASIDASVDAAVGDAGIDCDGRIGAKQASCSAPPSLAKLYRDAWCGMGPTATGVTCFENLSCATMESEIHAGHFPCLTGTP